MNQSRIITLAIAALLAITGLHATSTPGREFRGVWFTTVHAIDWPARQGVDPASVARQRRQLAHYVDRFASLRLNVVCFQVRSMADAAYISSIEPSAAPVTGRRGAPLTYDPLATLIDLCHARGIECYAWINPLRWSAGNPHTTPVDTRLAADSLLLAHDRYTVLNPALPAARSRVLDVTADIITRYSVDGVIFDDYFYPNNIPEDSTAADWQLYRRLAPAGQSIGDWRRANINSLIDTIGRLIEARRPDVRFGVGPAGVAAKAETSAPLHNVDPCPVAAPDWQFRTIYSDPLAWITARSIDFISPQLYWPLDHPTAPYGPLCRWWAATAARFGVDFFPSQSLSPLSRAAGAPIDMTPQIIDQLRLTRHIADSIPRASAPGCNFFSARQLMTPLGDSLRASIFTAPALTPAMTAPAGAADYPPVSHLSLCAINGSLSLDWLPVTPAFPGAIVRYAVSAISPDGADATLLGVTYTPSFTIPAPHTPGATYTVSVLDGWGRLHPAASVAFGH